MHRDSCDREPFRQETAVAAPGVLAVSRTRTCGRPGKATAVAAGP